MNDKNLTPVIDYWNTKASGEATDCARIESGQDVTRTLAALEDALLGAGFASLDYAALADAGSLALLTERGARPARLLVAARIGGTRLIDNMAVKPA